MPESALAPTPSLPLEREALAVARGISRLFARNGVWCLAEMPLRSGRRADLMGIDAKGRIVIVEIKVSRADLLGDAKWPDYLEYCDRFYWGLAPHLDRACLEGAAFRPDLCGVIVADGYDAEIVRPAPSLPLARRPPQDRDRATGPGGAAAAGRLGRSAVRRMGRRGPKPTRRWKAAARYQAPQTTAPRRSAPFAAAHVSPVPRQAARRAHWPASCPA